MSEEGEKSASDAMTTADLAGRASYRLKARGLGRETVVDLWDDVTGQIAATTTFAGKAVFASVTIDCGPAVGSWRAAPNRAVMPTSWRLEPVEGGQAVGGGSAVGGEQVVGGGSAVGGRPATLFSRPVGPTLFNPFARELVSLEREGADKLAVLDARKSQLGRLFNLESRDWVLARGEELVATFGFARDPKAPDAAVTSGAGPLGRLRRATRRLAPGDRALRSAGDAHALAAPEALVLLLLVAELTQASG